MTPAEFDFVLGQIDQAIALFNADHQLTDFNPQLARLWNLSEDWLQARPSCSKLVQTLIDQGHWTEEHRLVFEQTLAQVTDHSQCCRIEQPNQIRLTIQISRLPDHQVLLVIRELPRALTQLRQEIRRRKQTETALHQLYWKSQLFADITLRIRQSLQLDDILQTTVTELRNLLQSDRVLIYRILADGSGQVMTEAVTPGVSSLLHHTFVPEVFPLESQADYHQGQVQAIADVNQASLTPCHREFLHSVQVQAKLLAAIAQNQVLWGLIIVHQRVPRLWSEFEVELLQQLADQVGVALTHSQLLETLQGNQAKIRAALLQEQELSELKSRFIAMTSHEFRTPLTTILTSSELLEYFGDQWSDTERIEQLKLIQSSVQHLRQLLEDILLIGKAEVGKMAINATCLNLEQFCHRLISEFQLTAGDRNPLQLSQQCSQVQIYLDEKLLRQILSNLISNAVKYSPPGQPVTLSVQQTETELVFEVQDSGIGIPLEDQARLFESFHRAENVGGIPGTGLGLSIVKQCVDCLGGQITCTSQVGLGTTFIVTLPLHLQPDLNQVPHHHNSASGQYYSS